MPAHGVTIDRQTGGIRVVDTLDGAPIGIMASASEASEGDLIRITPNTKLADVDDGSGTIGPILSAIRKHTSADVILNVVAPSNLSAASGNAGTGTFAYRFLKAEAETGIKPKLFPQGLVGGVSSDLIAVANKLLGQALHDHNGTIAQAVTAAGLIDSMRSGFSYPAVKDDDGNVIGLSVYYAAVASARNFWEPISNIPLLGVSSLVTPISFAMGDATCDAQVLNNAKINTCIRKNGFRLWGGYAACADSQFKYLNVARTDDVVAESIQEALLWAVDQGITKSYIGDVVETIRAFLRSLKYQGAIIDGDAYPDPELNTADSVQAGQTYIDYKLSFIYPANQVIVRRFITTEYLSQIFG